MKTIYLTLVLALSGAGATAAEEVRTAPDWTLTSTDGEQISLSEVSSEQPVLVLFWATWCPYCKILMPHIQEISTEYGEDIRVLAVHFRDDSGDPVEFIERAGYDFTVLPDGDEVAELNGIWGTPGVLIIDQEQIVRFDLYELPDPEQSETEKTASHREKAAGLAPYWSAEIRNSLDLVLTDEPEARPQAAQFRQALFTVPVEIARD